MLNNAFEADAVKPTRSKRKIPRNYNTCKGLPLLHENRCIGKAVFGVRTEAKPDKVSLRIKSDLQNTHDYGTEIYVFGIINRSF